MPLLVMVLSVRELVVNLFRKSFTRKEQFVYKVILLHSLYRVNISLNNVDFRKKGQYHQENVANMNVNVNMAHGQEIVQIVEQRVPGSLLKSGASK